MRPFLRRRLRKGVPELETFVLCWVVGRGLSVGWGGECLLLVSELKCEEGLQVGRKGVLVLLVDVGKCLERNLLSALGACEGGQGWTVR